MKKTIVIGIDCMDYHRCKEWGINFDGLGEISVLKTIEPSWSPKCWAMIFSGKDTDEHGIETFLKENKEVRKPEDIPNIFIWNELVGKGKKCYAVNVPVSVPPYCFNCDFKSDYYGLETKFSEIVETHKRLDDFMLTLLRTDNSWDFIAVVYHTVDRAQHVADSLDDLKKVYKMAENSVAQLKQYADNIIVVSDHGGGKLEKDENQNGKHQFEFEGHHGPNGIFLSNAECEKPETIQDVKRCVEGIFDGTS